VVDMETMFRLTTIEAGVKVSENEILWLIELIFLG
jgi:hypothetical protein